MFRLFVVDSMYIYVFLFFFQAEDGIRDLVRSRGLGDVYKRQADDTEFLYQLLLDTQQPIRLNALSMALIGEYLRLSLIHI